MSRGFAIGWGWVDAALSAWNLSLYFTSGHHWISLAGAAFCGLCALFMWATA